MREVSGRKGVIVFTDGVHGGIPAKPVKVGEKTMTRFVNPSEDPAFVSVRRTIERGDTVFYFIAVNSDLSPSNVDAGNLFPGTQYTPLSLFNLQQVRSRMEQIAQVSGGRVVFPVRNADTGVSVEQIVRELGTSYSLGFTPSAELDGMFHSIECAFRRQMQDKFRTELRPSSIQFHARIKRASRVTREHFSTCTAEPRSSNKRMKCGSCQAPSSARSQANSL